MPTRESSGARWFTSSYATGKGNCVEVAFTEQVVAVRDAKDHDGGTLAVRPPPGPDFLTDLRH